MASDKKVTTNAVLRRAREIVARIRGKRLLEQRELNRLQEDDPALAIVVKRLLEEETQS